MKISIITNDGSPLEVTEQSIFGEDGRIGVGGSELALLTMCRAWHEAGHDVTLYNNPKVPNGSVFPQMPIEAFRPKDSRDILIIFRSPTPKVLHAQGKKIWWSCDQFTVDDFKEFSQRVDRIVGISKYHADYFANIYGIQNMRVIDIPVRTWEYTPTKKKRNSCIFTSVPDRGLDKLHKIWKKIVANVPDASLTITSDWSLWTGADCSASLNPYRMMWAGVPNVTYRSAINRRELIQIQSEAEFHLYPHMSQFPELFCISVAESQVAGTIPITSTIGAIDTTNRFGHKIGGAPGDVSFNQEFVRVTTELMTTNRPLPDISEKAKEEFSLEKALKEWQKVFDD